MKIPKKQHRKKKGTKNVEKLENIVNSNIYTSLMIGFHNQLNQDIQRSHPNIRSFKKCLPQKEARFIDTYCYK